MNNVRAVNDLHVMLDDGQDVLRIANSSAGNPFFDGGAGTDTLYDLPNTFDEVTSSVNFEIII